MESSERPNVVADLLMNQEWHASKVWLCFEKDSAQRILSTYLPKRETEDEVIWLHREDGEYSVKSRYRFLQEQKVSQELRGKVDSTFSFWKKLWKTSMSQRWRTFCWKLAHNALSTRDNLLKRNIEMSPECEFCGKDENASHLFLHCEVAKRIWSGSDLGIRILEYPRIHEALEEKDEPIPKWTQLVSILWAIWIHRNNIVFRKEVAKPWGILDLAKAEIKRWQEGFSTSGKPGDTQKEGIGRGTMLDLWEWGTVQQIDNSLQVDGAWKRDTKKGIQAAYGWVLECRGREMHKGSSKIFALTPIQAEAEALLEGALVIILTDSTRVVQSLHTPDSRPSNCRHLFYDIICALKCSEFCCVSKTSRIA
ncbi:hypothetical protein RDABS01_021699, partial [Bienertia sinuspersici]